ncbi:MAG: hypothetical protein AAGN82_19425 [Myxococcota bacterium]
MNRLAIIAAAGSRPSPDPRLGERDAMLVGARFEMSDLGFITVVAAPERDLAEQLDERFGRGDPGDEHEPAPDAIVFYASCLVAVLDDGECFLCLDPEEPDVGDALGDVVDVLASVGVPTLLILELRLDEAQATRSQLNDALAAVEQAVDASARGLEVVVALRPRDAHPERIPSRLTVGLLEAIDTPPADAPLTARKAYAAAIQNTDFGRWPSVMTHRGGSSSFVVRIGDETPLEPDAPPESEEPPTQRRGVSTTMVADAPPAPETPLPPDPAPATVASPGAPTASDPPAALEPPPPEPPSAEPVPPDGHEPEPPVVAPLNASRGARRPAPPSERKEVATVAWPGRRARPASDAPPKVVIAGPAAAAASASAEHDGATLRETTAEGPAAKRLERIAREALAQARADGHDVPERLTPEKGKPPADSRDATVPKTDLPAPDGRRDSAVALAEQGREAAAPSEPEPSTQPRPAPPPAPTSRKRAAAMSVDDHIEAGDLARDLGHAEEAVGHYKKGLAKLGTASTPERAAIYVRLGTLARAGGKTRVAVSNFDKALAIVPDHQEALVALVALEAEQGRWRAVSAAEEKLFAAVDDPTARLPLLLASGDRWRAEDARTAKERYGRAQRENPRRLEPLQRLLAVYRDEGAVEHELDVRRRIADVIEDPRAKAASYHELGVYCLEHLEGHDEEGYAAFELALDADPTMLGTLEALAAVLAESQEWGELERVYAKMRDRFEARERHPETDTVLAELHHRSALLLRDHLEDPVGALRSLTRELELRPEALSSHLIAAEVAVEVDDGMRALQHLRTAAQLDPSRTETYRRLFELGQRYDALEVSFLAASVLITLEAADQRERIIYREHRITGVPGHVRPLDEDGWPLLLGEDRDVLVDAIICAIAPAVLRSRTKSLSAEGKLPVLPDSARQDLQGSTLSVVRSIAWASQFLSVHTPAVFLDETNPGTLVAPAAVEQSILVGQGSLRGRSLGELAFISGRHLALRLPEHELVAHVQDLEELSVYFLSAVNVVRGDVAAGDLGARVDALTPILSGQQTPQEREALNDAVATFSAAGGRADLTRWLASVERCVNRAGLLMCGDLETAVGVLREMGEPRAFTPLEQRTHDLYAFAVSADYARLRLQLGSALETEPNAPLSAAPPPSS